MSNNDQLSGIASKSLGDSTSYAVFTDHFDPSLLNPMPRSLAREGWGIDETMMCGFDRWNCHEATFLTNSGRPIAGTLSFVYKSSTEMMIESKSMKLYLNSFDMCRMGDTSGDAINNYVNQVKQDLSKAIGDDVSVYFHWNVNPSDKQFTVDPVVNYARSFDEFDFSNVQFTDFTGQDHHIKSLDVSPQSVSVAWTTNVLRSRCRHTKQKDTGTALIEYTGPSLIQPLSIFKQIVSLREVNEFHEFCAEKLLSEMYTSAPKNESIVALFYSRRGSLDINPIRWTRNTRVPQNYLLIGDPSFYLNKTQGQ